MKRSLANSAIRYAEELLNQYNFKLPEFGYWNLWTILIGTCRFYVHWSICCWYYY